MKNCGTIILVLFGLLIGATGMYLYTASPDAGPDKLVDRDSAFVRDAKIKALEDRIAQLELETAALSNMTEAAEARYSQEKDTNEPLRKQIENMIGREVVLKAELEKAKAGSQGVTPETVGKMNARIADLENRLSESEKERASRVAELESLRKDAGRTASEAEKNLPEATEKASPEPDGSSGAEVPLPLGDQVPASD